MSDKHLSKTISYWLRHAPQEAGLQPDQHGWVSSQDLLNALKNKARKDLSLEELVALTTTFDKQRWEFSEDRTHIRATHGHSIQVSPTSLTADLPQVLYHGTYEDALQAILQEGLKSMSRQYVHLSETMEQARAVALRHGKPIIFRIETKRLTELGIRPVKTASDVWLVDSVPAALLERLG